MRTDDGYIIDKCLNGEPESFGLLVEKYKVGIYAFVLAKIHNYHDAQEVAQDVFIKAYTNLNKLKRWDSFAGWLYRIAINSCKNRLKILSRRPDSEFAEDQTQETIDEPSIDSYRDDILYLFDIEMRLIHFVILNRVKNLLIIQIEILRFLRSLMTF